MAYNYLIDFSDKIVVVTGGLGLLGREIVRAFVMHNATVVLADNGGQTSFDDIFGAADSAERVHYFEFDITDADSVTTGIAQIAKKYGNIDVWVNSAYPRTADWGKHLDDVTFSMWNENIRMQLGGYFWSTKEVLRHMQAQGRGSLVNLASIYGVLGPNFNVYEGTEMTMPVAYSAIKGAIVNLTRYFAAFYGPDNIRVNSVCPGGVFDDQPGSFVKAYGKNTPLGRMAKPTEIAMPIVFLASDAASYITGHSLMVDGGWSTW